MLKCVDLSTLYCRYIDTLCSTVSFRATYSRAHSIVPVGVYHLTPTGYPPLLAAGECSEGTYVMRECLSVLLRASSLALAPTSHPFGRG